MRIKKETSKHSFFPLSNQDQENEAGWQVSYLDIITLLLASFIIILSISQSHISSPVADIQSTGETEFLLTPIDEIKSKLEVQLMPELNQGSISIVRELNDLRITFNSRRLYYPGEAILSPEALPLLDKVVNALQATYHFNFNIDVEGHTDSSPIVESPYPSNWELSTARAANVVKYLSELNVEVNRLKASGYAYSRPMVPNEDSFGNSLPENKEQNRRIVLRIYQDEDQLLQTKGIPAKSVSPSDSWENSNCSYSLQTGYYQSLNNAIQAANKAVIKSGLDIKLTYNNSLFSVRTSNDMNLKEAMLVQSQLSRILMNEQVSIIHQCDQGLQWLHYQIQFASFRNQDNADRFISRLRTEFNIEAISSSTNTGIKILTPPISDVKTALDLLNEIKTISSLGHSFLTYDPRTVKNYSFNYHLQLAHFDTEREAVLFINSLPAELELIPEIQRFDSLIYVIDKSITDWNRLLEIRRQIKNHKNILPFIHLIEMQEPSNDQSIL